MDFRRYGRYLLIAAFVVGLFLSRHFFSCYKETFDEFALAGEVDDGTTKGLIGKDGSVGRGTKGDYSKNFSEGSGFFGHMFEAVPYCIAREPFSDPIEGFYLFWGLILLGGLGLGVDRLTGGSGWKKNIRKQGKEEDRRSKERKKKDRSTSRNASIAPIDVGRVDKSNDIQNVLVRNDDYTSSSSIPARPGIRKPLPPQATPAPDPFRPPPPPISRPVSRPRPELEELGLGSVDDLMGNRWLDGTQADPRTLGDPVAVGAQVGASLPQKPKFNRRTAWMPAGREKDHILFAAPSEQTAQTGDGSDIDRPVSGLKAAIELARQIVNREHKQVQIRVLPGIYLEQVRLPARVALINHAIPKNLPPEERRFWLTSDEGTAPQQQVVLALPKDAEESAFTLQLHKSNEALVAGIHIVGSCEFHNEPSLLSAGIHITDTQKASFYLCHVVGHRARGNGAAFCIERCGKNTKEHILIQDSLIEGNAASGRGGGLFIHETVMIVRNSAIQGNEAAKAGGGIYLNHNPMPLLLESCLLQENSVYQPGELPKSSRSGWTGEIGHGGGIFVSQGGLHLKHTNISDNKAQSGGGGVFASASKLLIEGDPDNPVCNGNISGNLAKRGAGILLSGLDADVERPTALRMNKVELIANHAEESGGGLALYKMVQADLKQCRIHQNQVSGEFGEGGGIHCFQGSRVKLDQTKIERNTVSFRGAGISVCNASLRVFKGCLIAGNNSLEGDSGGIAFYTMESKLLDELRQGGKLEEPVVLALGPCPIRENSAKRGAGGLFVGNFVRNATLSIAFAIKDLSQINDNLLDDGHGNLVPRSALDAKPVELVVLWKGVLRADESKPPEGKQILR